MTAPRIPWVQRNPGWKLLSLGLAIALWLVVAGEPDVATAVTVPLQLLNVPTSLAIASNPPGQVRLSVRGPSGQLTPEGLARVAATVDLSGAKPGDRIVPIDATNVTLPRGVSIERAQPSEVDIRLEELIRREIPVRVRVGGAPGHGWELDSTEVVPPMLPATGPASNMQGTVEAATEPLDLSQLQGEGTIAAHALLEDPSVRFEGGSRVTVKVKLRRKE